MTIKSGLFPEEAARLKKYLAMDNPPNWKELAREFKVKVKTVKNFYPKVQKKVGAKKED